MLCSWLGLSFVTVSTSLHFFQNNNITDVNIDTFCRSNDTYYLRPKLSEVRMDGNPVVLSKYPDSFTCMKVLPVGQYRWEGRYFTVAPLLLMEQFSHNMCWDIPWRSGFWGAGLTGVNAFISENLQTACITVRSKWNQLMDWLCGIEGFSLLI